MGLDGVELIMEVEEFFDITISDAEVRPLETPKLLIEWVCQKVDAVDELSSEEQARKKLSLQRVFYRVRKIIADITGIDKRSIRPSSRLVSLFSREKKRAHWLRFKKETGLRHVPSPNSFFERRFAPNTVREIVEILVAKNRQPIVDPYPFSKKDVREAIRRITTEITGITDFSDDDKFVQDLGID